MKKILIASAVMLAISGSARADTVTSVTGAFSGFTTGFASSTPPWVNLSTSQTPEGTPFWNDPSADAGTGGSHMMNIGSLLTDSGGFAGTPSVLGGDSVTQQFTADGGADPTAFSFLNNATAYNIALLFAESSLDTGNAAHGTVFGTYTGTTFTPLYTPVDSSSPSSATPFDPTTAGNSYGFYATVCYEVGLCETYTSGNGNFGNVTDAAGWNHFALFELASGSYVIGFEDTNKFGLEGQGDFNDIVVELQTPDPIATPEPSTIAITGAGLAGLLLLGSKRNALKRLFLRVAMLQRPA
jgi:hypothetical protein